MLSVEAIAKRFEGHQALAGATLELPRGETLALLGPSGCGKTTLLRVLAGFETADSGRIVLDGRDIASLPPSARNIGLVFQDYALFPHMTVARNIEYGLRRRAVGAADRKARLAEMLDLVRLQGLQDRRPAALSGGQQQRVALARALAISPPLLLLDEPLSNLDAKLRTELADELRATLRAASTTTLIVTHDQSEAMTLGDRIAVMSAGRIVQTGTATTLYSQPNCRFVAEFLGRCNWLAAETDGIVATLPDGELHVRGTPTAGAGIAIRPESIRVLAAGEPGGVNAREAAVAQVTFLGQEALVRLILPGGPTLLASTPPRTLPMCQPGATVRIDIDPDDCRLVPDQPIEPQV